MLEIRYFKIQKSLNEVMLFLFDSEGKVFSIPAQNNAKRFNLRNKAIKRELQHFAYKGLVR